ncbi:hypothetical protein AURDEDRAFT_115114 [Auricularia subglabra TFB-10046 SS5]|nr:hypothetical protein AURDEDRAFT_115114 [Auricularia subglabra TFB-10046 SS5]
MCSNDMGAIDWHSASPGASQTARAERALTIFAVRAVRGHDRVPRSCIVCLSLGCAPETVRHAQIRKNRIRSTIRSFAHWPPTAVERAECSAAQRFRVRSPQPPARPAAPTRPPARIRERVCRRR